MLELDTEPGLGRDTFLGRGTVDVGLVGGKSGGNLVTAAVIPDMFDGVVLRNICLVGHPLGELNGRHCVGLL